jgi:hypothetical protein
LWLACVSHAPCRNYQPWTSGSRQQDAEMLIAISRLTQEAAFTNRRVRVDDLSSLLADKWDAAGIARSLERLELLACIEMGMEAIILNETIVVSQME